LQPVSGAQEEAMKFAYASGAAMLATLFLAGPALAHASLVKAMPAADSAGAAPDAIELQFSEGVEPKFSGFEVTKAGAPVALAKLAFAAGNKTMSAAPKDKLAPGLYKVSWHAVADDLHKTEGTFSFTVK
jgi:methionine-rich copper-binding protein CopC